MNNLNNNIPRQSTEITGDENYLFIFRHAWCVNVIRNYVLLHLIHF